MTRSPTHRWSLAQLLPRAVVVCCLALAGCGTLATPVLHEASATTAVEDERATETQPTAPPTETAPPPANTPVPLPTATSTPQPTPTLQPTAAPRQSPIDRLVAVRDADKGALLFNTFQDAANYACANCHLADSEKTNLGPGLLNIKDRAALRVEGQSAAEYIYKSIVEPQAFIVAEFDPELMPQNWAEIYEDLEIFDIVAYLMTLAGESDIDDPAPEEVEDGAAASS